MVQAAQEVLAEAVQVVATRATKQAAMAALMAAMVWLVALRVLVQDKALPLASSLRRMACLTLAEAAEVVEGLPRMIPLERAAKSVAAVAGI